MATEFKSILRRTGTEAELSTPGQLLNGQLGIATDTGRIISRTRAGVLRIFDPQDNMKDYIVNLERLADGMSTASIDIDVIEDAGNVKLVVNNSFDAQFAGLNVPFTASEIVLIAGTDELATLNFVYLVKSGGVAILATSISGFPAVGTAYASIATVIVQTAPSIAIDGARKVHAWTDHFFTEDNQGRLSHITDWIRDQPATHESGVSPSVVAGANQFDVSSDAGVVRQLHNHVMPPRNTASGDPLFIVNDSTVAFRRLSNLTSAVTDAAGSSLLGKYYNIVIWGIVNEKEADCKIMVNLPTGSYSQSQNAINDKEGTAVFDIPAEYRGVGFLIARITMRNQSGSGGTFTTQQIEDLRGKSPSNIAGGAVGSGTVSGSGTPGIMTKWSANGMDIEDSLLDDDGTNLTNNGASFLTDKINVATELFVNEVILFNFNNLASTSGNLFRKGVIDALVYNIGGNERRVALLEEVNPNINRLVKFANATQPFLIETIITDDGSKVTIAGLLELLNGTSVNEISTDVGLVGNSDDAVPTEKAIKTYVDNIISSGVRFQGSYDAATDTPSLDDGSPIAGITKGDMYIVSVAGTFFTEPVDVGDMLIAKQDSPNTAAHWAALENNLTDAQIKTKYENNADTNAFDDAAQTKLGNIETAADVTDAANVTAAGALMKSLGGIVTALTTFSQGLISSIWSHVGGRLFVTGNNSSGLVKDIPGIEVEFAGVVGFIRSLIRFSNGDPVEYRKITINDSLSVEADRHINTGAFNFTVGGLLKLANGSQTVNEFSTDGTLAGNSDSAVPTEKAVKTAIAAAGNGAAVFETWLEAGNLATVAGTTGFMYKTPENDSNTVAGIYSHALTSPSDVYNNGNLDPFYISETGKLKEIRIWFSAASVSTGTVGTPVVRIAFYKVDSNGAGRTQIGANVDIPISATGVGVFNNTGTPSPQEILFDMADISVSAGDLIGWEFKNIDASNDGINQILNLKTTIHFVSDA